MGVQRAVQKSGFLIEPVLTIALRKAGPPSGYSMAPNSKHGGYRKKVGGKWVYWYEGDATTTTVKPQWGESHFVAGKFDKNPEHWAWTLTHQRMIGGVAGGVDLQSKQPVKIAGMPNRLWQIVDAEKEPGWAQLRDVKNGEKRLIEHERVMPVHWQIAARPVQSERGSKGSDEGDDDKEPYDPTEGEPDDGPITGYAGKRIPPFEASVAPEGTALWSIENGAFQFKAVQRIIADAAGVPRKVKRIEPFVPDVAKVKLISEFEPLLRNAAKQAYKMHALKATMQTGPTGKPENLTMQDLTTSATEGLLRALQHYPGGMSFAAFAKHYVHGHVRVEAGRMRLGGVKLADREQRMLPGFIAARATAGRKHGVDAPSAEQVAVHWRLLKRDLHTGLSSEQGTQPVPLGAYRLRGEGAKGPKSLQHYPGKAELAERLLGLLEGERSASSDRDETEGELFPGTGGRGLDTEPKISAQHEIKKQLQQLESHTIESERTSYRTNTAAVLTKLLGLDDGDPVPLSKIASTIQIERKVGDAWKPVAGARQQQDLVQRFVDEGLKWLRKEFEGSDFEGVISQAGEKHGTRDVIPAGPTYNEIIRKQATKITPEQVSAWRRTESTRLQALRDRYTHELSQHEPGTPEHSNAKMLVSQVSDAEKQIKKVSHRTIALRVVLDSQRESNEMRRLQTQTVTVEPQGKPTDYHEVFMTDPAGNQRKVRVKKVGGSSDPWSEPIGTFNKSDGPALTSGMLAEHMRWPLVTRALYAPTDRLALLPTQARLHFEGLVGLT